MKARGFTILEVLIASSLFAVMFGIAVTAVAQDSSTHRTLDAHFGPELRSRKALEFMTTELRMAGIRGEDRNGNGILDANEDVNENLEFDADWNLKDGTVNQASLTFNRRVEVRFSKDDVTASSVYSRGITYQLENESLIRVARQTDFKTGKVVSTRTELARGVLALRFSRDGSIITVALDIRLPRAAYKSDRRTVETKIFLRN